MGLLLTEGQHACRWGTNARCTVRITGSRRERARTTLHDSATIQFIGLLQLGYRRAETVSQKKSHYVTNAIVVKRRVWISVHSDPARRISSTSTSTKCPIIADAGLCAFTVTRLWTMHVHDRAHCTITSLQPLFFQPFRVEQLTNKDCISNFNGSSIFPESILEYNSR